MALKIKVLLFGVLLILSMLWAISPNIRVEAAEPTLEAILDSLGFTNRVGTAVEMFPAGVYKITLYAEYAGYRDENTLSWYKVGTSDFNLIFSGPEGVPPSQPMGLVSPPLTKSFIIGCEFGLSFWSPDLGGNRYFTETVRNLDGQKHVKIYQSLDDPAMFFIGFENLYGGGDRDFNDMVVFLGREMLVGGAWIPPNKFELLAPCISLASSITVAAVSVVYIRHRKKQQQ